MHSPSKLFENIFNEKIITPSRLILFANHTLNRLIMANANGNYTRVIDDLTLLVTNFENGSGEVYSGLTEVRSVAPSQDQLLQQFKQTMSNEESFIARALGGSNTQGYLQFYPGGVDEYSKATKASMPLLVKRVNAAATANAAAVGPMLTTVLQNFETDWQVSESNQLQSNGVAPANHSNRSRSREALELGLLSTIHVIGAQFPGNVQQCLSFFDFNMLFEQTKQKYQTYGTHIAASQTVQVLNRAFIDTDIIIIRNPDENVTIMAWLAATADANPPGTAIDINPGETYTLKPSQLGSLTNNYLLIHNTSAVKEGAYEVEVVE